MLKLHLSALSAVALLVTPAAEAATVTVTTALEAVSNYDTFDLSVAIAGFDSTLGTLQGATASIELALTSFGAVFADPFGGDFQIAEVQTSGIANLSLAGALLQTSPNESDASFLLQFGPNPFVLVGNYTDSVALTDLAALTSNTITGNFFGGLSTSVIGGLGGAALGFVNELKGELKITYDYDADPIEPQPVPVPAGLPLLLTGLLPVAMLRRRSKKH